MGRALAIGLVLLLAGAWAPRPAPAGAAAASCTGVQHKDAAAAASRGSTDVLLPLSPLSETGGAPRVRAVALAGADSAAAAQSACCAACNSAPDCAMYLARSANASTHECLLVLATGRSTAASATPFVLVDADRDGVLNSTLGLSANLPSSPQSSTALWTWRGATYLKTAAADSNFLRLAGATLETCFMHCLLDPTCQSFDGQFGPEDVSGSSDNCYLHATTAAAAGTAGTDTGNAEYDYYELRAVGTCESKAPSVAGTSRGDGCRRGAAAGTRCNMTCNAATGFLPRQALAEAKQEAAFGVPTALQTTTAPAPMSVYECQFAGGWANVTAAPAELCSSVLDLFVFGGDDVYIVNNNEVTNVVKLSRSSLELCALACLEDPQCRVFDHKPADSATATTCWLHYADLDTIQAFGGELRAELTASYWILPPRLACPSTLDTGNVTGSCWRNTTRGAVCNTDIRCADGFSLVPGSPAATPFTCTEDGWVGLRQCQSTLPRFVQIPNQAIAEGRPPNRLTNVATLAGASAAVCAEACLADAKCASFNGNFADAAVGGDEDNCFLHHVGPEEVGWADREYAPSATMDFYLRRGDFCNRTCALGSWKRTNCTSVRAAECAPCRVCSGSEFEAAPCTATSDRRCSPWAQAEGGAGAGIGADVARPFVGADQSGNLHLQAAANGSVVVGGRLFLASRRDLAEVAASVRTRTREVVFSLDTAGGDGGGGGGSLLAVQPPAAHTVVGGSAAVVLNGVDVEATLAEARAAVVASSETIAELQRRLAEAEAEVARGRRKLFLCDCDL